MKKYCLLVLLLFVSLVLHAHPARDAQGAQAPVLQSTSKQPVTANSTRPLKKAAPTAQSAAIATAPTLQQPARKKQPPATAAAPSKAKKQQTAKSVKRQVVKQTKAASAAKRATASASQTKTALKKTKPRPAKTPVHASAPAGTLLDIDKQISSKSAMVMDAQTGETIFAKSPDNPRQPASTIKIITGMIALKSLKQDDIIDVSNRAAAMPSSKIFLDPAKNYQANDLINAVLLSSANDASVALAEKIAGSEDKFANLMTLSAKMWGARNTVCRTASGLTADGQQSTARDLANLFRYAMQNDEFARRMREKSVSTSYGKTLRNHNKALWRLDGAVGGKTGYTSAARQTYVGQFSRENQTIVVAIMGSESMWADLEKLVNYGFRKKKETQLAGMGYNSNVTPTRVN
jgi:serine-type D-Ala-D-Ala carboxypeptidase (penicillin-binding protein 5/6)